jgi:hypothetical protein
MSWKPYVFLGESVADRGKGKPCLVRLVAKRRWIPVFLTGSRGGLAVEVHRTFVALSPRRLGEFIMTARQRVIYVAPSLSLEVSSALINARDELGPEAVSVVLDVSEDVFRLGYGVVDALKMCHKHKIAIRHADGIRISFVVVDKEGFIFVLPPWRTQLILPSSQWWEASSSWGSRPSGL